MKRRGLILCIAIMSLLCLVLSGVARADTFIVNNTNDSGPGSMRQDILDSNSTSGPNTIAFNILGGGPADIVLLSALPVITTSLTIDGSSQPGFTGTPLITIDTFGLSTPGVAFDAAPGVTLDVIDINVIPSNPSNVPEPSSLALLGAGFLSMIGVAFRKKQLV